MIKPIRKQVKEVGFSLVSPNQVRKLGVVKIVTPELYDMDGYPVDGGLMDLRLGAIDPGVRCRTCGGKLKECLGHFGYMELARPVMHVKYIPVIELLLRTTCSECGKILLSKEDVAKLKNIEARIKKARDVKRCSHCKASHEKIKLEKPSTFYSGKSRIFPSEIRARLSRIPDPDCELLGINPKAARPEWAILTLLLVPPVTARPSITLETGERSEDDLTHKLGDIIRANQRLWENLNAGAPEVIIEDLWDLLQYHVTSFFDNTITQIPPARHRSGQPLETITERIKGKEGRIRHNLAGKRVNFSSRTVISPDPYLKLNEVGVPPLIARILTVPEVVTSANEVTLRRLIEASDVYPGANYVVRPDGKKKRITEELKQELLDELTNGYIVERHLQDGDVVLFNRHPSLHRASLMSHYVKVLPGRTFRLHPGTTFPYNADFDGDEMNVHVPQTEEARAEAKVLLDVAQNMISPKNNSNNLGAKADAITGNYLLTSGQLTKAEAQQLLAEVGAGPSEIAQIKKERVSGREIFSALLPSITFVTRTKACRGEDCPYYNKLAKGEETYKRCRKEHCPVNAYLSIKDGKLLSGVIDKNSIGVEAGELVKELDKEVGRTETISVLERIFRLGAVYLSRHGFTMGLLDVDVSPDVKAASVKSIQEAEKKVNEYIEAYRTGKLEQLPGKTLEETRETKILQILNDVRTKLGVIVKRNIPETNPVNRMILSGAGSNMLHITQMACSVGQQALWARRIDLGYVNRTLSFFVENDLSPAARGFISSSYFTGLLPHEFFFGAITGRDGLMDTALRTPKSGYLYRRIANALQDLKVEYDGTVRDATGKVVQFKWGEDGTDVSRQHLEDKRIAPGEAVGIVTAQSFGEPSTQMTLNVFHFAGVSEMAVTVGLPRLVEIFDARKKPSTPSMEIYLDAEHNNEAAAATMAKKIKMLKLGEIANKIDVNFVEKKIELELDKATLRDLRISSATVLKELIEKKLKARLKGSSIIVRAPEAEFKELFKLKEKLKDILVAGVKGIQQVRPFKRDNKFVILTAGSALEEVLKIKGVDQDRTRTNDIHEIAAVRGIEAARQAIVEETERVISQQGLDVDPRHIMLIADAMTASGDVKGITRMGIIAEKTSILARASFETPIKHFVNASIQGSKDKLSSVIENVILNQPVPIGTGLPGLFVKITGRLT